MYSYIWDSLYYLGKGAGRLRNIECEMKRTVEVILCDPQLKEWNVRFTTVPFTHISK